MSFFASSLEVVSKELAQPDSDFSITEGFCSVINNYPNFIEDTPVVRNALTTVIINAHRAWSRMPENITIAFSAAFAKIHPLVQALVTSPGASHDLIAAVLSLKLLTPNNRPASSLSTLPTAPATSSQNPTPIVNDERRRSHGAGQQNRIGHGTLYDNDEQKGPHSASPSASQPIRTPAPLIPLTVIPRAPSNPVRTSTPAASSLSPYLPPSPQSSEALSEYVFHNDNTPSTSPSWSPCSSLTPLSSEAPSEDDAAENASSSVLERAPHFSPPSSLALLPFSEPHDHEKDNDDSSSLPNTPTTASYSAVSHAVSDVTRRSPSEVLSVSLPSSQRSTVAESKSSWKGKQRETAGAEEKATEDSGRNLAVRKRKGSIMEAEGLAKRVRSGMESWGEDQDRKQRWSEYLENDENLEEQGDSRSAETVSRSRLCDHATWREGRNFVTRRQTRTANAVHGARIPSTGLRESALRARLRFFHAKVSIHEGCTEPRAAQRKPRGRYVRAWQSRAGFLSFEVTRSRLKVIRINVQLSTYEATLSYHQGRTRTSFKRRRTRAVGVLTDSTTMQAHLMGKY
ncbi:hypothetical protein BC629DRAFT_1434074 [Irpex lacteus]|nr:hypothetical protein BC629DRAFT_1434074 [Irpex lacteus]